MSGVSSANLQPLLPAIAGAPNGRGRRSSRRILETTNKPQVSPFTLLLAGKEQEAFGGMAQEGGDWGRVIPRDQGLSACSANNDDGGQSLISPTLATLTVNEQKLYPMLAWGVSATCTIARMSAAGGQSGSVGNVANIVACSLAVIVAAVLAAHASRRIAAVGRREMIVLLIVYALTAIFQLLDTGSFFLQGSTHLAWVTGVHVGLVVVFFWTLLWNSILGFQWVEDGTLASLLPWGAGTVLLGVGSTYIALDTAFSVSGHFASNPPASLHNDWLFSLTVVWPLVASFLYFVITAIVVLVVLRERRPLLFFIASALFFALGEGARYALWHKICTGSNAKIDGSFVATLLETLAMGALYAGWRSLTEDNWTDDYMGRSTQFEASE